MDNDPQPRAILDPSFDIFDVLRWATHTAYPEARIPETPKAEKPEWCIFDSPAHHSFLRDGWREIGSRKFHPGDLTWVKLAPPLSEEPQS